jgi:hypothetical protein
MSQSLSFDLGLKVGFAFSSYLICLFFFKLCLQFSPSIGLFSSQAFTLNFSLNASSLLSSYFFGLLSC